VWELRDHERLFVVKRLLKTCRKGPELSEPSARVILDSVSPDGVRLTTLECVMHRFVLAEFNTHRMFSRNSASSRAIPVDRQLERVATDPAMPVEWPQKKAGMQGGEALSPEMAAYARSVWELAAENAIESAKNLELAGVHKSVTNRLLEPFMWHTVIVTATEWENFWGLRCSRMAQPEIRMVAEAMRVAFDVSRPFEIDYRDWHAPYIQPDDPVDADFRKVSAARCARVSYLTHDGKRDLCKDLELYERLVSADPPHLSPLEHVATPALPDDGVQGNLRGWHQLRHQVEWASV
jgi:thymidylate synthase ThyX